MSVALWRIAMASRTLPATDLGGRGAERSGGRWNNPGRPVVYASSSIALACLETVVHFNAGGLPLNRELVHIEVPDDVWAARLVRTAAELPRGWDEMPAGPVSAEVGNAWLDGLHSALLVVPSAIVPEEFNVLLNPRHAWAARLTAAVLRRWSYDGRLLAGRPPG
jgi:RES domain-containing protein